MYTAGKRTEPYERPTDGTPVIDVDRGGKITWHGPGQLVGYPIVRLADPVDVVAYVRRLEGMLIEVLAELGVDGQRVEGRCGVWLVGPDRGAGEKIAAIGIRVAEGVTMHGFALNCSNAFEAYEHDRRVRARRRRGHQHQPRARPRGHPRRRRPARSSGTSPRFLRAQPRRRTPEVFA